MSKIVSIPGIEVTQKNFHQIIIRGNGSEKFNNIIEEKTSIKPPSKNLEIKYDSNYLFGKNSPDQWSLVLTDKKDHNQILNLVVMYLISYYYPNKKEFRINDLKVVTMEGWKYTKPFSIFLCAVTLIIYITMGSING